MRKILRIGKDIKASNPHCPERSCHLQASKSCKTGLQLQGAKAGLDKTTGIG